MCYTVLCDSCNEKKISSTKILLKKSPSARVGLGLWIIDSSICVAHITGFPMRLHFAVSVFCTRNTCSGGISIPKSPRATIMPSASAIISSALKSTRYASRKTRLSSCIATATLCCPYFRNFHLRRDSRKEKSLIDFLWESL